MGIERQSSYVVVLIRSKLMGDAKRRKQAAIEALSQGMEAEQRDAMVRQAYANTRMALDREADLLNAILVTYNHRNATLDFIGSKNPPDVVACRSGCSACCHQMVACSPFEVFIIAQLLQTTSSDDELKNTIRQLYRIAHLPLTAEARYGKDLPCPLLQDAKCSVYERRPSTCRAVYSNSRQKCEDALARGGGDISFLLHPQMMLAAIQIGIDVALRRDAGLNTESVELCGALLHALADFDGALDEWLRGGDPFAQWQLQRNGYPTHADLVDSVIERLQL